MESTCNKVNCADNEVASVCSVWTFLSSSDMYLIFLSFDLAADCRFAQILMCTVKEHQIFSMTPNHIIASVQYQKQVKTKKH